MTDTGEMRRRLGRGGQLVLVIGEFGLAALGVSLAVAQFHDENPIRAVFLLLLFMGVGWTAVGRLRIRRGWVKPARAKALEAAIASVYFGVASAVMALVSFVGKTFRSQVGTVGGDVLGVLWAIGAVCLFWISWIVWPGRQSLPTGRGGGE